MYEDDAVVYTTKILADFLAYLLIKEAKENNITIKNVFDPSCGNGKLLDSMRYYLKNRTVGYYGSDIRPLADPSFNFYEENET